MECPICKGKKKTKQYLYSKGTTLVEKGHCIVCGGTGKNTQEEIDSLNETISTWLGKER